MPSRYTSYENVSKKIMTGTEISFSSKQGHIFLNYFFSRPLATFFPMPSGYTSCDEISSEEKETLSVVGSELMKGTGDGNQANICILNQEGVWATEPVTFTDCGGFGCCRFEFVNQPPQE